MRRRMLRTKIHRATVTAAELNYVGSVSIDRELMDLAGILPYEQVAVLDVDNGARFETYAIVGGPGEICLNGAAARLVSVGDRVILLTYADYSEEELADYSPVVVHVDGANQPVSEAEALALGALVGIDDPARRVGRAGTDYRARRVGRAAGGSDSRPDAGSTAWSGGPGGGSDPEVAGPTAPDRRAAVGTGST